MSALKIVPLMKTEFTLWHAPGGDDPALLGSPQVEYRYDVTLVWQSTGEVLLVLLDKRLRDGSGPRVVVASGVTIQPTGCVMQYGSNLIVSIFDLATYIAYPTFNPAPTPWSWHVETLGKDVCPTPATYDFPQTLQGDLLIFSAHRKANETDFVLEYDQVSADDPTKVILRLPIQADYTRAGWLPQGVGDSNLTADSATIVNTKLIPRWKVANKDVAGELPPDNATSTRLHFQHRGYFYRFVEVRQFTNTDGNPVKLRSNPSAEIFVPAVNYSPFFWSNDVNNGVGYPQQIRSDGGPNRWFPATNDIWNDRPFPIPVPNIGAMGTLQSKYRNYYHDTNNTDGNGAGGNVQWAAAWLGWFIGTPNTDFEHLPPYQTDVSAEELTSAPQTIFNWADFAGLSSDAIQIEVYRTAYEDVDPVKRPVSTPLFKPHIYGLVGTIDPNGTFTDTTKIPDFGQDPGVYEGYLRGQFSGDVLAQYGQSPAIVLGNVRVDYAPLAPSPLVQAFCFDGDGVVVKADLQHAEADGFATRAYWFAYQDINGFRSAATPIAVDTTSSPVGGATTVGFTFPVGYDPVIVKLVLYVGKYAASVRTYYEIATVDPEPGTYTDLGADATLTLAGIGGDNPKFYEPDARIYSLPDSPWDWPPAQAEKGLSGSPVRGMFDMMGELAITMDSAFELTLLRVASPRSERDTQALGLITKHAAAKVEDAVVILSQHGLYFLVPSRPEKLPSHVTVEVLAYLTETIPKLLPLADLRRASIGYHDDRKELYLHIPSSIDLWPKLPDITGALTLPNPKAQPQRTYIFRFLDSLRKMENYTFDINPDFEIKNYSQTLPPGVTAVGPDAVDISTYNSAQVLFAAGSAGDLWCSYTDPKTGFLVTQECDVPELDYPGAAYATISMGLSEPAGQKQIARTEVLMQARGTVEIITGIAKPAVGGATSGGESLLAGWDAIRGFIHNACRVWKFRRIMPDQQRAYNHPAEDVAIETKGSTVMVRLRTTPDSLGRHRVTLNGLTVFYDEKHKHG